MRTSITHFIKWSRKRAELLFWTASLLLLACIDPANGHIDLCLFKMLGFGNCPGCGLGHSISYLFRGNLTSSIESHALGIPALMVITSRIFQLAFNTRRWNIIQ